MKRRKKKKRTDEFMYSALGGATMLGTGKKEPGDDKDKMMTDAVETIREFVRLVVK